MKLSNSVRFAALAAILLLVLEAAPTSFAQQRSASASVESPDGMIDLISAPSEEFTGRIFLINDWDGGDADNQNAALELNRNPRIKQGVTILSDLPDRRPRKVIVNDLVKDAKVLAKASQQGRIGIAMGAHSRHMLAWLTELPGSAYNYQNITIVTHSNWNELDGRKGYEANKKPGDPPLEDTHGVALRRGLYLSLAKISDLGVTILEIPRTDSGPGGWGGSVAKSEGGTAGVKALDISDLGLVHYLKTGVVAATRQQRNQFVSASQQKPATLNEVNRDLITEYWDKNRGVPGKKADYLPGGKLNDQHEGELLYNGIRLPAEWPPRKFNFGKKLPTPPYLKQVPKVIPIDVGRQLFVDDFLIESTTLSRTYHKPEKYSGNPLLKPETPLELNQGLNPVAAPFSDGAFYDPAEKRFKLWYQAGWFNGVALAVSKDGLNWTRPELDVVPGSNRVVAQREDFRRDGVSVWLDHDALMRTSRTSVSRCSITHEPENWAVNWRAVTDIC